MRIIKFMLISTLFLCVSFAPLRAQDFKQTPMPQKIQYNAPEISTSEDLEKEMTIIKDQYAGQYKLSNIENLSKLYWRLGAFDSQDDQSIENFIKINDCKIYETYSGDDFEWKKIMASMTDYLSKESKEFPLKYQFSVGLALGKYDSEQGGFPLVENTAFKNSRLINVESLDYRQEICKDSSIQRNYPKSVIILMPKPFNLDFIKLDEHVAQAYIIRNKNSKNRNAHLRLRVSFDQYVGNMRGENQTIFSVLYGKIDGYEVFEDNSQKNLLLSVDSLDENNIQTGSVSTPVEQNFQMQDDNSLAVGFTSE